LVVEQSPILIVPYMWIGDFVRCHSVVKVARERWPARPIDYLTSTNNAPLVDYMPGLRKGIVWDLPRRRLPPRDYLALGRRLRQESYGTTLVMLRTWKSALAPFLAGIPERVGFLGEGRWGLLTELRRDEFQLRRMIDRCASLALPTGAALPAEWPLPELIVPPEEVSAWLTRRGFNPAARPVVALAPGAVGDGKRWPTEHYTALAARLTAQGIRIWVVGSPNETPLAQAIMAAGGRRVTDLTGSDLRNAILALKAADAAVSNDSGLMHVAAALGTPTVALFGPTDRALVGPLNPLAAVVHPPSDGPCPQCGAAGCQRIDHRRIENITPERVLDVVNKTLATAKTELHA
jgi:heptosyltransferase-2